MVITRAISFLLALRGHLAMSGDLEIFLVVITMCGVASSIYWVEARNASEYPQMHRAAPTRKDYLG